MKIAILVVSIVIASLAFAQNTNTQMGARGAGLAYATATIDDEWGMFNNAGALGKMDRAGVASAYEVRPSLEGSNRLAATFFTPIPVGSLGLGFFRFGDALYNEHLISAAYGHTLGITSLGLRVTYHQHAAEGYEMQRAVSVHLGGITQLSKYVRVGAYIANINQPKINVNDKLPARMAAGASYQPSAKMLMVIEIQKTIDHDPVVKYGFEYILYRKISFRTGFNLNPSLACFGVGYMAPRIRIDYSLQHNRVINLSHQVSALYQWKAKTK